MLLRSCVIALACVAAIKADGQELIPAPEPAPLVTATVSIDTSALEATLSARIAELESKLNQQVVPAPLPEVLPEPAPIIDYSNGDQLAGVPGVVDGVVNYHMQWPSGSYTHDALAKTISEAPDGGYVLFDCEVWRHTKDGDYWNNDEEKNIALFRAYADTIWHFGPELRKRKITLHIYQAPVTLASNFTVIRRPPGNYYYDTWEQRQLQVLWQAEHAGMLEALRACKGGVALPLYIPATWADGKRWAGHVGVLVDNLDRVLDEKDVPHVWMIRPDCDGKPLAKEHLEVLLGGPARNRLAVWGTPTMTGWDELREAMTLQVME